MKIALMGTRGIPASYSGFETCVEQLGQRLVDRGHQVTVYCRSNYIRYSGTHFKGMRLLKFNTIPNKYLDTIFHSLITSIHALSQFYDIGLYFIAGNSPVTWILKMSGTKTILNVDGLDWKRDKWPGFAKFYIKLSEYLATKLPHAYITDSKAVQKYYRDVLYSEPYYIPYGSEIERVEPGETLKQFGLEPDRYILFVGRLVPENCVHHLIDAFKKIETDLKCVIVGDAPYAEDYIETIKNSAGSDPRIIFTGYVFGRGYRELGSNATVFVETSGVGGTHPALLEAMAFGNCIVTQNTPENLETLGSAGLSYSGKEGAKDLERQLKYLLNKPEIIDEFRKKAYERAQKTYSWDVVTDSYERLFYQVCKFPMPDRLISH